MNKTVQSILSLTAFSLLLIVVTFFFAGLGFGRLFGIYGVMECCSVLLWLAFICLDQNLLDWQITDRLLKIIGLDGFTGDERGMNIFAVLCGIIYPPIGIVCLFIELRSINKSVVTTRDNI
jgi:hypothetical protein